MLCLLLYLLKAGQQVPIITSTSIAFLAIFYPLVSPSCSQSTHVKWMKKENENHFGITEKKNEKATNSIINIYHTTRALV